jgi:hypothetical protein
LERISSRANTGLGIRSVGSGKAVDTSYTSGSFFRALTSLESCRNCCLTRSREYAHHSGRESDPFIPALPLVCNGPNQLASPIGLPVPRLSMNAPLDIPDLEVIIRFLRRFSDLMSTGSNSDNLLLAATLLEMSVKRANEAEDQLRQERSNSANLESKLMVALLQDTHALIPISILRLAASQFQSMARTFEISGDVVSQAMCEASSATLARAFEADTPRPVATNVRPDVA